MSRLRATAVRFLPLCLLAGLAAMPASAQQQGDCGPITPAARRTTAEPPTIENKIRPVPNPTVRGSAPAPAMPFPPANSVSRSSPNDPPVPSVSIRIRVPAEVTPGQEVKYNLVAENVSRADAHHVTVRVPVPTNAKYVRATPTPAETEPAVLWKLGTLRAGEKKDLEFVALPTGDGEIACCARVQFEHGQCVKTKLSRPGVQVKKSGPVEAAKYDPLKFRIEVSNTGRAVAKNVVVEETLPAGLDYSNSNPSTSGDNPLVWKLGDLEPGKTRSIEYDAIPSAVGPLTTKAVVSAEGGKREASHTVKIGEATLSVSTFGPKHRHVGRPATYRLVVRNTGTLAATHVELSDFLPSQIEYVGSQGGQLKRDVEHTNAANEKQKGDEVKWSLGTIAPGAARTVSVTVRAKQAGSYTNVGSVTADRGVSAKEQLDTRFDVASGLALEIEKGDEPLAVGQTTEWTVRVLNRGTTDQANVGVIVRVPEGLKAAGVRGAPDAKVIDNRIQLPQLARLAAGDEKAVVIRLAAEKPGEHRVLVESVSDANGPDTAVKVEETLEVGGGTKRTSERPGRQGLTRSAFVP